MAKSRVMNNNNLALLVVDNAVHLVVEQRETSFSIDSAWTDLSKAETRRSALNAQERFAKFGKWEIETVSLHK